MAKSKVNDATSKRSLQRLETWMHNNLNLAVHFAFGEPSTSCHLHEAFAIVFVITNLFVLLHFIYPPSNSFVRSSCSGACATPTAAPPSRCFSKASCKPSRTV
ncbi:hypothetical protein DER46DRAFT_633261 [Fusarium sp. MPI-SDFR-AT-0072]|nr:hypothetical protein DER46DRAFT_633261 [Fusarium sp. MPI-SDFR-AT-0072]